MIKIKFYVYLRNMLCVYLKKFQEFGASYKRIAILNSVVSDVIKGVDTRAHYLKKFLYLIVIVLLYFLIFILNGDLILAEEINNQELNKEINQDNCKKIMYIDYVIYIGLSILFCVMVIYILKLPETISIVQPEIKDLKNEIIENLSKNVFSGETKNALEQDVKENLVKILQEIQKIKENK